MTQFLAGPGFGGAPATSIEAKALKSIDSRTQPFVNKDFVRNIAWLNQSVDTLSAYTQKLQKGVDSANQNVIEQIQGFAADLLVVFAGLEPTGIELGDLKYVLQGIGALLGINPDTPFPLNLLEAGWHFFNTYVVPLPQFTDLLFDAIIAWAEALGFTDAAVDAIEEFNNAVLDWYNGIDQAFGVVGELITNFLKIFGLGSGFGNLGGFFSIFDEIGALINQMLNGPRDMLLNVLSNLIVLLFKTLTFLVNLVNPMRWLGSTGMNSIGPQQVPEVSDLTTEWNVGVNPNTSWVYDDTYNHGGGDGCFRTNCLGTTKRLVMQDIKPCSQDQVYSLSAWVWWQNVNTNAGHFGPVIVWYQGVNEVGQIEVNASEGYGTNGGWTQFTQSVTVPIGVDGFRVGAYVGNTMTQGIVRVDQLSCTQNIGKPAGIVDGILGFLNGLLPWNIFQNFLDLVGGAVGSSVSFVAGVINGIGTFASDIMETVIQAITGIFGGHTLSDLGQAVGDLFADAQDALSGLGNLAGQLLNNAGAVIGNIAQVVVDGAGTLLGGFFDMLRNAFNPGTYSNSTAEQVADSATILRGNTILAQISAVSVANLLSAPKNVPYWVSPNPFEEVTYPRSSLAPEHTVSIGANTGAYNPSYGQYNSSSHRHYSPSISNDYSDPVYAVAAGTLALMATRIQYDRIINTAGFITNGANPPATVYAKLYLVDPATGNLSVLYDFGNISTQIATGTGLTDTRLQTASDIPVNAGDIVAVGILPVGAGITLAAIRKSVLEINAYPASATELLTGQATPPDNIVQTSLTHLTSRRVWACVGQITEEDLVPLTFVETFNGLVTGRWTSNFWNQWGTDGLGTTWLSSDGNGVLSEWNIGITFDKPSFVGALAKSTLHSVNHSVKLKYSGNWPGGIWPYVGLRAYLRCRNNGSLGAAMLLVNEAGNIRASVRTVTDVVSNGTERATATQVFPANPNDEYSIEAVGNTYTCYRNGVAIPGAQWVDSGGVIPITKSFCTTGFGTGLYVTGGGFTLTRLPFLDEFVAADLEVA